MGIMVQNKVARCSIAYSIYFRHNMVHRTKH